VRSRSFIAVAVLLVLLVGGAVSVYAYDRSRQDVIANGVRVAGVDVGGLHPAQARARLRHRFLRALSRPVVVTYDARRFVLTARRARVAADVDGTVDEALARSRQGSIFTRVQRGLSGGHVDVDLQPQVSYSRAAVLGLVRQVAAAVDRPARDASVSFTGASVGTVAGHEGVSIVQPRLRRLVEAALLSRSAAHHIRATVRIVRPKVTTDELAARYPTVLTIDRGSFALHLFKHLKLAKTYRVAVGRAGLETPAGLYHINDKQVNPSWHVPNSSWAGSLAGKVIPPGPQDPIKARWMGIYNGAGIHGTTESDSLGSAASHGCIRMAIPDVIELYDQVPFGTPVYIA
jgi:lipoprotein-anchoring transpeptidase ErfK/SrfK